MGPGAARPAVNKTNRSSETKKGKPMPILLWLIGIPIPLIILILLLR
jgi:hypothetical protein